MKYLIADVSKITNIPIDTIRYYVKLGIITPEKQGNYHYYDVWDINYLLEYRRFKECELSRNAIKEIFVQDDLDAYLKRFENLQDHYIKREKYYQALTIRNKEYIEHLREIPFYLNQFKIVEMPNFYYLKHRQGHDYFLEQKLQKNTKYWYDNYYSFLNGLVIVRKEEIFEQEQAFADDYLWAIGIEEKFINLLEDEILVCADKINSVKALYTVLYATEQGSFNIHLLEPLKQYVNENGYVINGDIVGVLLARVHEKNGFRRYIGFWIPIE